MKKMAKVTVTIEEGDTVEFDPASSDHFVEVIKLNMQKGEKTRVSDIVAFASTLEKMKLA